MGAELLLDEVRALAAQVRAFLLGLAQLDGLMDSIITELLPGRVE